MKQYPRYKEIIYAANPDLNEEDRAAIVEVLNRYVRALNEQDAEALVDLLNLEHLFSQGLIKTRAKAIQWACSNFLHVESRYAVNAIKVFKKYENQALVYLSVEHSNRLEPALDKMIGLTKQEDGKWLIAPYYGEVWKFAEQDLLNAYERNRAGRQ